MASYRLYCLDGAGHIGLAEWLEAEDDAQALAACPRVEGRRSQMRGLAGQPAGR